MNKSQYNLCLERVKIEDFLLGMQVVFITFDGELWLGTVFYQGVDLFDKRVRIGVRNNKNENTVSFCYLDEAIEKNRIFLINYDVCSERKLNCSSCPEREFCISGEPLAVPCPSRKE